MNDRWLLLDPVIPVAAGITILILTAGLFLFLEWRKSSRFLWVRLGCVIAMTSAIAGIFLRPKLRQQTSAAIVILAPGYDENTVDSLLREKPYLRAAHIPGARPYPASLALQSVHELSWYSDDVAFVTGAGLPPEALDILDTATFHFIPASFPSGIVQLQLPREIYAHRTNILEGVLSNVSGKTMLVLEGPGGKEDSVMVDGKGFREFRLAFTPKETGNFLYRLHIGDSAGTIPMAIREQAPLNILMIQHYPTFEARQLKSFLSAKHRLLFRYEPSRDRFRYEYINRKPERINRISQEILSGFDLLIIDSDGLANLSANELTEIKNSAEEGLGILVLFNENPMSHRAARSILPVAFIRHPGDTAALILASGKTGLPVWPVSARAASVHPVVRNRERILAAYISDGFGKVGFQLLQETYRLALAGDTLAYSAIWTPLIERTARTGSGGGAIFCETPFPRYENAPVTVRVSAGSEAPQLLYENMQVPLAESVVIDDVWNGKLWAGRTGWHSLSLRGDSAKSFFYVSEKESWQSLATANNIRQTFAHHRVSGEEKITQKTDFIPVSPWLFYGLFLLSCGVLWLAPKL